MIPTLAVCPGCYKQRLRLGYWLCEWCEALLSEGGPEC